MKSITTSLRQNIPIAMAKVVLVLTCLISLSILLTGCPSPSSGDNTNNNNNNNQDPTLLPMARVSVNDAGEQANGHSFVSSMSSDGNLIAYYSEASNLVANDTNSTQDVFVFNRKANTIKRVSVSFDGGDANGYSIQPVISANGGFVTFESAASNLVTNDSNNRMDIFVFDLANSTTARVSVDAQGVQANDKSENPAISADGRFVAFDSLATNLVPNDTNNNRDVFVFDSQAKNFIERVSVSSKDENGNSVQSNGVSMMPSISADGRFVAFYSDAANLVTGDTNNASDIYVYDRQTKTIELISMGIDGVPANGSSTNPDISANGRFVAFESEAGNLVANDDNGIKDIFVFDRQDKTMERASLGEYQNNQIDTPSAMPAISADGRFVAFQCNSDDLVGGDDLGFDDIYLRDREKGTIQLVSVTSDNKLGNKESTDAFISADGHYLSFQSEATNMLPGDANDKFDIIVIPIIPAK